MSPRDLHPCHIEMCHLECLGAARDMDAVMERFLACMTFSTGESPRSKWAKAMSFGGSILS